MSLACLYTRYRYIGKRILLRMLMGKRRRNEYLAGNNVNLDLVPEVPMKDNGVKAIPRKKSDDFLLLFMPREQELMKHLDLKLGETFVDVGANVGYYTLKVATDYGQSVRVIAIEAHPDTYRALCRNIRYNGFGNIIVVNKAVLDRRDSVIMYEEVDSRKNRLSGHASLCRTFENGSSLLVEADTLDNILAGQRVDVMKMDIEGAEVMALGCAKETLGKLRKIIVEVHGHNLEHVMSILEDSNFSLQVIRLGEQDYVIGVKGVR